MRYLALAASVATYWMLVACVRLLVHAVPAEPAEQVVRPAPPLPDVRVYLAPPPDAPGLSKVAFVRAMNAVKPEIARCYDRYGVPGMVMVNLVVAPEGQVSGTATGRFADTPTGACVERALRHAPRLPRSCGLHTPFPFQLR